MYKETSYSLEQDPSFDSGTKYKALLIWGATHFKAGDTFINRSEFQATSKPVAMLLNIQPRKTNVL